MIRAPIRKTPALVLSLLTLGAGGCALLGKSEPLEPRYLSPESIHEADAPPAKPVSPPGSIRTLHLGRVASGSYLKERIVFRDGDHEVGFYDDRRWTERPEVYLERALERALFDEGAVRRSLQTSAPTLTANLIAFEEVRQPRSGVRLTLAYALHDDRTVLRGRTLTVERPLADGDAASQPRRVASAMGEALRAAVEQVVAEVLVALPTVPRSDSP